MKTTKITALITLDTLQEDVLLNEQDLLADKIVKTLDKQTDHVISLKIIDIELVDVTLNGGLRSTSYRVNAEVNEHDELKQDVEPKTVLD